MGHPAATMVSQAADQLLSFSCLVFTSVVLASGLIITNNRISSKATSQTLQCSYYLETQALLLLSLHCYFIGSLKSLDLKKIDHHISIVHSLPYALTLLRSWFRFHSPSLRYLARIHFHILTPSPSIVKSSTLVLNKSLSITSVHVP